MTAAALAAALKPANKITRREDWIQYKITWIHLADTPEQQLGAALTSSDRLWMHATDAHTHHVHALSWQYGWGVVVAAAAAAAADDDDDEHTCRQVLIKVSVS